uniref:Uncharacterized protein n=1 Tax=Taeniopygia guttata TaxID=59729 RepID=A0A674GID9_TAEGU
MEAARLRRDSDYLAKFKEKQWEKVNKNVARVHLSWEDALLGWEGFSPHTDSGPASMCYEPRPSTVSVGTKSTHLHPCSQRNKSLTVFKGGSSRKRALLGLTSEEGGFGTEILLPCTVA